MPMMIREIDPTSDAEIALVAQRMRETLIEVEGQERGANMYSMPWLEDRVRWHLNPANIRAKVMLAIASDGEIVGHTIFRIETADSAPFGLISTSYIVPHARRSGWAAKFLEQAHHWFRSKDISTCCTWTSSTNIPLISLYRKFGYQIVEHGPNDITDTVMVKLVVRLIL